MNHSIVFVLAVPLLLGACTVSASPPTIAAQPVPPPPQRPPPEPQPSPPRQPAVTRPLPPPPPEGQLQTLAFATAYGRPQALRPGAEVGYWIWSDRRGQWHVRTTSLMQPHRFHGGVVSEGALIEEVGATRLEWSDRIRASAGAIDFDFATQTDEDGFDFRVAGDRCLRFNLNIDGRPALGLGTIGAYNVHTRASYFRLCP